MMTLILIHLVNFIFTGLVYWTYLYDINLWNDQALPVFCSLGIVFGSLSIIGWAIALIGSKKIGFLYFIGHLIPMLGFTLSQIWVFWSVFGRMGWKQFLQ